MASIHPQLDFLITASNPALESFELSHLNRRAILRKETHELLDKWADAEVEARFARWILDCRRAGSFERASLAETLPKLFSGTLSDTPAFLPSGETSVSGTQGLTPNIPQLPRMEGEPLQSSNASLPCRQLVLPLGFAATSPSVHVAPDPSGTILEKLKHRAQRSVNGLSWAAALVPPTRADRPCRPTCSSSSSSSNSHAVKSSAKSVAAQTSLFTARDRFLHAFRQIAQMRGESGIECSVRADSFSFPLNESMSSRGSSTRASNTANASVRFARQTSPRQPDRTAPTQRTFSREASIPDPNGLLAAANFTAALPQIASSCRRSTRAANSLNTPNRFSRQASRRKQDSAASTFLRSDVASRASSPVNSGYRARKARRPTRRLRASSTMYRFWQARLPAPPTSRSQQQVRAAS